MSERPDMHTYDLVLVETRDREKRRAELSRQRSSPWLLGAWASAALVLPCTAWLVAWWWMEPSDLVSWGVVVAAGLALLPITALVLLGVYDRALFEHTFLTMAKDSLSAAPAPSLLDLGKGQPPELAELRPGILMNGNVAPPLPRLSDEKARLKSACLLLVRAGAERGSWTRAAIAEGVDAMMPGELWDLASPELQRLGYFWNKPGKGGGLRPSEKMYSVAEIIERLAVAQ